MPADGTWRLKSDGGAFVYGHWETRTLAQLASGSDLERLKKAGYDLNEERPVLVLKAENDDAPIVFAFRDASEVEKAKSGMGGTLGQFMDAMAPTSDAPFEMVSFCNEMQVWTMDGSTPSGGSITVRKPVIYLYPQKPTEVSVQVAVPGGFSVEYPRSQDGKWHVVAEPDGTLFDRRTERRYGYLFWEAQKKTPFEIDPARAYCIEWPQAATFLEKVCTAYGLNDKETTDLVTYWLPALEQNELSLVQLLSAEEYGAYAPMTVTPEPDTTFRLFFIFRKAHGLEKAGNPDLPHMKREGFTLVEWGGANLDERG